MTRMNFERKGPQAVVNGAPPIVFVHGFACRLTDWAAQVAHLSPRHDCIAIDLPGHGFSAGTRNDATIETLGAAVATLLETLNLPPAVLVGHSMGCRVIVEALREAPAHVKGLVLVDGSRLAAPGSGAGVAMAKAFDAGGYEAFVGSFFPQMFLADSDPKLVREITEQALSLPKSFGAALLPDIARWDEFRFDAALGEVKVPMQLIQSTYTNPERKRMPMRKGQNTPYFDYVRACVPHARFEVIADVGHFPQIERACEVNAAMHAFLRDIAPV